MSKAIDENLRNMISNRTFYKIDFALINNSLDEISLLTFIYTLSGFSSIDISASPEIISKTKKSISDAMGKVKELGLQIESKPLLMVSMKSSLLFKEPEGVFKSKLVQLLDLGIDAFELHLDYIDLNVIKQKLNIIKINLPYQIISISISRKNLSNANMIELIRSAHQIIKKELIVEVNEINDNSSTEKLNTTLQNISTADIINKQLKLKDLKLRNLPILLAGGNNLYTPSIAEQCGVPFNGITFELDPRDLSYYSTTSYSEISDLEIFSAIERAKILLNKV